LEDLQDGTVLDGELVALNAEGHADFNLLQNFKSAEHQINYYAFDVMMHKGKSLTGRSLAERRDGRPCKAAKSKRRVCAKSAINWQATARRGSEAPARRLSSVAPIMTDPAPGHCGCRRRLGWAYQRKALIRIIIP
jgi:hypothetical protein